MSPEYIADVLPYLRRLAKQANASINYGSGMNTSGYNDYYIYAPGNRHLNNSADVDAEILRLQNIAAVKRGERVG